MWSKKTKQNREEPVLRKSFSSSGCVRAFMLGSLKNCMLVSGYHWKTEFWVKYYLCKLVLRPSEGSSHGYHTLRLSLQSSRPTAIFFKPIKMQKKQVDSGLSLRLKDRQNCCRFSKLDPSYSILIKIIWKKGLIVCMLRREKIGKEGQRILQMASGRGKASRKWFEINTKL